MKRDIFFRLIFPIAFLFLILGAGCGTTKSVYKKVRFKETALKKRVLVLPLLDQAGAHAIKAKDEVSKICRGHRSRSY
jgi:hypothetical protein